MWVMLAVFVDSVRLTVWIMLAVFVDNVRLTMWVMLAVCSDFPEKNKQKQKSVPHILYERRK